MSNDAGAGLSEHNSQSLFTSAQIRFTFWCCSGFLAFYGLWSLEDVSEETVLGYFFVLAGALLPCGLWAHGIVRGVPIFPCFCVFNLAAFGLPLIGDHPTVVLYRPSDHLEAGAAIGMALVAGTIGWSSVVRRPKLIPTVCYRLGDFGGENLLLGTIALSVFFNINTTLAWISLPGGVFSAFQGVCNGLSSLATFVLGQRWGARMLRKSQVISYAGLVFVNCIAASASLYLVNSIAFIVLAVAGFTLGRRKIPWLTVGAIFVVYSLLHMGKGPMRVKYWTEEGRLIPIYKLSDYVPFYGEWIGHSIERYQADKRREEKSGPTLLERTSLIHLLLYTKERLSQGTEPMMGATYAIIPRLMVPRILDPSKPWTQEGTTLLNIHFGLQTREEAEQTTVGWGLLNEGYANFESLGCIFAGLFIGVLFGVVTRISLGMPFLSLRMLLAVLVLGVSFQNEYSLGVFITVLWQSAIALTGFAMVFMKKLPVTHDFELIAPPRPKRVIVSSRRYHRR